ncbi:radical SAM protein [Fusibacter sp. JL298sf-3]
MYMFKYKEAYKEEDKRILEVNILPEKCCNFDCIFCPIGRSNNKTDLVKDYKDVDANIADLKHKIESSSADLVFINSSGEALFHSGIDRIIDSIKSQGKLVRLLSNGYILNDESLKKIASKCDEVIGEIKVISELDFQKLQRPLNGYTLEDHIFNMVTFRNFYKGKFILEMTIIKGYNDTNDAVEKMERIIRMIKPDEIIVVTMDGVFEKKLGVTDDVLESIKSKLINVI